MPENTDDYRRYAAATVKISEASQGEWRDYGRDNSFVYRAVSGTIYAACTLNATQMAGQPLRLYRKGKAKGTRELSKNQKAWLRGDQGSNPGRKAMTYAGEGDDVTEVLDHPVLRLLADPDPMAVGIDFLRNLFWFKQAAGRVFYYMGDRIGGERGEPTSLYTLFPQYVVPVADKGMVIKEYVYGRERAGDQVRYDAKDVMYLRSWIHPANPLEAMSWVQSVVLHSDMENAALNAEIARWRNGGQPSMVLEIPEGRLNQDAFNQKKNEIQRQIRGPQKAGDFLLLQGVKLAAQSAKPHEMNYKDGFSETRAAIYRAAGIPETVYEMSDANRASAEVGDVSYLRQTVVPEQSKVAMELTEMLLPEFGVEPGEMWLCFDSPVKEDQFKQADAVGKLYSSRVITQNEARAVIGLDPVDGGDEFYVQPAAPEPDGDDEAGENGDDKDAGEKKPPKEKGGCQCESCRRVKDDRPRASASERAYEAMLDDLEAWYREVMNTSVGDDGVVKLTIEQEQRLQTILDEHLPKLFRVGQTDAAVMVNATVPAGAMSATEYLALRAPYVFRTVPETLQRAVLAIVDRGIAQGDSIATIQVAIMEKSPETSAYAAERIARSETMQAAGAAKLDLWKKLGFTAKTWSDAGDACPVCTWIRDNNPGPIPLDAAFIKSGQTITWIDDKGKPASWTATKDIMSDGDPHPNCRCGIEPSESKEEETRRDVMAGANA